MSKVALDLNDFKHLTSDKNTTHLKHKDGHILIIEHKTLPKEHQEQLKALSSNLTANEAPSPGTTSTAASMAEGGEAKEKYDYNDLLKRKREMNVEESNSLGINNAKKQRKEKLEEQAEKSKKQKFAEGTPDDTITGSPIPGVFAIPSYAQNLQPQQQPSEPLPDEEIQNKLSQASNVQPDQAPIGQNTVLAPQDQPQPEAEEKAEETVPEIKKEETPEEKVNTLFHANKREMTDEVDKYWEDLQNQHIQPKTIQSMFHNAELPQKLGMIFGMMFSGMGSGLSHQPNAFMQLAQQALDRDFEAQKLNVTNKQNLLHLRLQAAMNRANISSLNAETATKEFALHQSQMLQSTFHSLSDTINKLPEGPEKQAKQQTLAMLYPEIANKINNITDLAAAASARASMFNNQQTQPGTEQDFQQKQRNLMMMGMPDQAQYESAHHFPGIKGQSSVPLSGDDRNKITSGINFQNRLDRFMLFAKAHSGDLNPADYKYGQALAAELQGAYRQATNGGVYKEGEQNFISKIINDDPTAFFNKVRVLPSLNAVRKEHQEKMKDMLESYGFSNLPKGMSKDSSSNEQKDKDGKPMIQKDGKWYYKK